MSPEEAEERVIKAIGKGLLKILSKMGISTIRSYTGAQIFEAVGLARELVDRHFTGTPSRIGGVGLDVLAARGARPPRPRLPGRGDGAAAGRRRLRRGAATASSTAGTRRRSRTLQHAARDGGRARTPTSASPPTSTTWPCRKSIAARPAALPRRRRAGPARRGRARDGDRQALQDRRDEPRRAVAGGARDARGRHEPPRRQVEHRRGRRGPGPLRRRAPLVDQAGRLGPLRRDHRLPRQRRRAPDQGRPGRQARRGRPAARATRSTATSRGCATRRRAWA